MSANEHMNISSGRVAEPGLDTTHGAILYLEEITVSFDVQAMGATAPNALSDVADPALHSTAKM